MTDKEMISISEKRLLLLEERSLFLEILEGHGVDNWDGYGDARAEMRALEDEAKTKELI